MPGVAFQARYHIVGTIDRAPGDRVGALSVGNECEFCSTGFLHGTRSAVIALGRGRVSCRFSRSGAWTQMPRPRSAIGSKVLWLGRRFVSVYQFFDGLKLEAAACVCAAPGDAIVYGGPGFAVSARSFGYRWRIYAYLQPDGQGVEWHFLPQLGWGAYGGWMAWCCI